MSISYSYGQLSAALQAWAENTAADFQTNMADIMQKGELRLYHALDLDNLDPIIGCGPVSMLSGIITKPGGLIRERTLSLVPPGAGASSSSTVALLHFLGANGGVTVTDSAFNFGPFNVVNGFDISTATGEFPGGALDCLSASAHFTENYNGSSYPTNNPACYAPVPASANVYAGVGDFTIEAWFRVSPNADIALHILNYGDMDYASQIGTTLLASSTGINAASTGVSGWGGLTFASSIGTTNWHHIALVRKATIVNLFLDGVLVAGPTTWATYSPTPLYLSVGSFPSDSGGAGTGWVQEVRISNSALYTTNFTPPIMRFPNPFIAAGGSVGTLNKRSYEFVTQYLIDNGSNNGTPKYYAEENEGTWQLAPLPDQAYTLNVRGIFRPTLLGDNPETTNLAGIAASAHLVTVTPMTLTASPFVYSANVPSLPSSQVWIYSAGNMSANSFTIVGLDDDGNAQTEVVVGPSAGSVQSIGYYSSITSITPALTDAVQFASVGWCQDNQTWLSSRFGDLLFWYCMVEACQFNKRWTAAKEAEAEITKLLPFAQMITRSLKRADYDDLYSGRQNVGAPGAVPLPVPPQTGVQQGGAGQP